jgi:MFS family permease
MELFGINRFHLIVLSTWQICLIFVTQLIFPVFFHYVPKWRCLPTESFGKNCTIYESCNGKIEFDTLYFNSMALEFDWICGSKSYLTALFSQVQFFGVLIGTLGNGSLSDHFGRKWTSLINMVLALTMMLLSAFAYNWKFLFVCRFILGYSIGGIVVVVYTFIMELILPSQRMILRCIFNWGIGRLVMTATCYYFNDWRTATIASVIFAIPSLIIIFFFFPESPTWLHYKGKMEQMKQSERKIANIAGVEYQEISHSPVTETKTILDIIRDRHIFKRVVVLWVMWFVAALSSYGVDLNSKNINGNIFINQVGFAIVITISKYCLLILDTVYPKFSRRKLHQGSQLGAMICCVALVILTYLDYEGVAILIPNLFGIVFMEYTWDACYLCGIEVVPTPMRTSTLGSCSLLARVGALLSPVVRILFLQICFC